MRILLFLLAWMAGVALADAPRPNIVFVLADDMSFDSVSANNPAMGPLETPHIDRLIAGGMNFTDAHSGSAVCTPTRYGLLTGRYCWRSRLKNSVLWTYGRPLLEPEQLTVAELLHEQGYTTAMIGKWHLGLDWYGEDGTIANRTLTDQDAHFRKGPGARRIAALHEAIDFSRPVTGGPLDHGFDHWFGVDVPNFPPYTWIIDRQVQGDPSVMKPSKMFGAPGPMVPGWKLEHILKGLGDHAEKWIGEQAGADAPFFLYMPLTSPHLPTAPSESFQDTSGISRYADFVIETDAVVGQVVRALEGAKVERETLVIFSTDNGTSPGGANFPLLEKAGVNLRHHFKGHKAQIHEGGHRVPFVASWPGTIGAGSTCDQVIGLNDFMATVADLLEVPLPDDAAEDSTSLLDLLTGEATELPDRPWVVNHDIGGTFAIRDGDWKLVAGRKPTLFNLADDPKEAKNLAGKHPERVKGMRAKLDEVRRSGRSRP